MKSSLQLWVSLWITMVAYCQAAAQAPHVNCNKLVLSADPDYPPLHWFDGKELRGPSIDLATRILGDLKIPYEVRYVGPWNRVLANASAGTIDLVATLKLQPTRERYLQFVSTPAFPNPIAVFVDRDRGFSYKQWTDLRGKKGGRALGNRFGTEFEQFASTGLLQEESGSIESNFRKLALGRIDYFVVGLFAGEAYIAKHQLSGQFMSMRPFVTNDKNYFAFAKNSPCLKYYDAFESQLSELVANKSNLAILRAGLQSLDITLDSGTLRGK